MDALRILRMTAVGALLVHAGSTALGPVAQTIAGEEESTFEPSEDGLYAVFKTTLGTFVCRLEPEKVPVTVGSFVGLSEGTQMFRDPRTQEWVSRPFYDGLKFHRVAAGYVVQAGDPLGDGTGGPGYEFIDEFRMRREFGFRKLRRQRDGSGKPCISSICAHTTSAPRSRQIEGGLRTADEMQVDFGKKLGVKQSTVFRSR